MTTPNPALVAAAPSLINALQAIQQFEVDMGVNPLVWAVNYPGAKLKLLGSLALQLPQLATAEAGVVEGIVTKQTNTWISQLQAIQAAAAAPPAAA